ncbi:MAG TPA: outer membrane lipid asymmetry maintenance protein MlaD [Rhodospirillales bacterium]|nr:outer membrane lipid asymmetry maintenance protein MlaD [Rhodospirillales bacterium]
MKRNAVETVLGAVVLLVAAGFVYFAYDTAEVGAVEGYNISAVFYKIGGLNKGSDVRVNGIKVGTVKNHRLNPETFDAEVSMSISAKVQLPDDTVATIASEGMLGGKYVRLEPGTKKTFIKPGGKITKTNDFRSLEDQVGEIIFLATGGDDNGGDSP